MKKMQTFLLMVMAMTIPFIGNAQKPNTKSVAIKYVQPPSDPLGEEYKTYYINVVNRSTRIAISNEQAAGKIKLQGFERVSNQSNANLKITYSINDISSDGSVEKVTYDKKINDETTVKKTGGVFHVKALFNYSYKITDLNNNSVIDQGSETIEDSFKSQRYNTYSAAVSAYNDNRKGKLNGLYQSLYNSSVEGVNGSVNDKFGFPVKTSFQPIARGKGKKHDYSDLETAYASFLEASKLHGGDGLNDNVASMLKECVFTWEKASQEYKSDKKARIGDKNIGPIHYNIAVAKILLNDFDGAIEKIETAKQYKVSKLVVNNLESIAKKLKVRHEINN